MTLHYLEITTVRSDSGSTNLSNCSSLFQSARDLAYRLSNSLSDHLTVKRAGFFKQVISKHELHEIMSLFELINLLKVKIDAEVETGVSDTDKLLLIHQFTEVLTDLTSHVAAESSVKRGAKSKRGANNQNYYTADFARLLNQFKEQLDNVKNEMFSVIDARFNHLDCEINWLKSKLEIEINCEAANAQDAVGNDKEYRDFHAAYQRGLAKLDEANEVIYSELLPKLERMPYPEMRMKFLTQLIQQLKVERRNFDWQLNAENLTNVELLLPARELLRDFQYDLHLVESRVLFQAIIKARADLHSMRGEDALSKSKLPDFLNQLAKMMSYRGIHNYSYDSSTAIKEHTLVANIVSLSDPSSHVDVKQVVENIQRIIDSATDKIRQDSINPHTKVQTAGSRSSRTEEQYLQAVSIMTKALLLAPVQELQASPDHSARPN